MVRVFLLEILLLQLMIHLFTVSDITVTSEKQHGISTHWQVDVDSTACSSKQKENNKVLHYWRFVMGQLLVDSLHKGPVMQKAETSWCGAVNMYTYFCTMYCLTSNIRHTTFQNLNVSCLVLLLSLTNPLKQGVKSRMKMQLEQRWQAMLQLHLSSQQLHCLLRYDLY